jgi:crotonobetainyl-CoA:carnitine CoA-transferase CaiB-like acyl-CoA transferase
MHRQKEFTAVSLRRYKMLCSAPSGVVLEGDTCGGGISATHMATRSGLSPTHDAPYRGLRVLDFGQGIASPYCAMLLAVYGADVIKIEPPEGDWSRFLGTTYGSHTTLSAVYNRGKRSLCLDLKHKDGLAVAKRLARNCDILIEGFRPGVAGRLGLGYEELSRDNPRLIYLSVSGFGQSGPYSKRPGSDSVAQAFSGLVSINPGNDGTPHRVGTPISDVVTGVYAFQAIATTLFARSSTGTGRWIDVNLAQSTAALLGHKVAEYMLEGGAPRPLNVPAGTYRTSDGWMMVTLVNELQYKRLCAVIDRDDLASDPRFGDFARRADAADALIPQLRQIFGKHPTEAWLNRLHAADIIAERILNPGEWLRNAHVEATKAAVCQDIPGVGRVYSPRTPGIASLSEDYLRPAPDIGQDSYEVLLEAGLGRDAIDDFVKAGVVRETKGGEA